jgi:DNA-directed RNA polymerase specialized sigma24 family protein
MSKKKKGYAKTGYEPPSETTLLEQIAHLLETQVRLNLYRMKNEQSQPEMISTLESVGCAQSEIADFLGISANTVKVSLYRSKKKGGKR